MCLLKDGGSISLGVNEHNNPNVAFTPTLQNSGMYIYYPVNLTDMKINGQSMNLRSSVLNGAYGALVDSGTTLMIFPSAVFDRLRNVFNALCSGYSLPGVCGAQPGQSLFDGYCYPMTDDDRKAFPTISFRVPGNSSDLTITPNEYLIAQNASMTTMTTTIRSTRTTTTKTRKSTPVQWKTAKTPVRSRDNLVWCLGIQSSPASEPITILGDTFMRGFYVVFDQQTQSVGFGPQSACP